MKLYVKFVSVALVALVAGCSVSPDAFNDAEIKKIVMEDRAKALANVAPVDGAITLEEAIARSLKYNLDLRTKLLEQSLAASQLEAGKYDMLPKLMANAGYFWRNNDYVRFSANPESPDTFTNNTPFISTEREHIGSDLTLSWSLLDFGASYYTAKQNADKVIVASERRRKAMHNLIQNVRSAYWRAVAAQTLNDKVSSAIARAEVALQNSRAISSEMVRSPDEPLRFQRNLLENLRLLESVQRDLVQARVNLANLMGLSPGTAFKVVEPSTKPSLIGLSLSEMEEIAMMSNSDLREKMLDYRIAINDTRKAILKLLPGLSFDYGVRRDDDLYLKNEQWQDASVRVSYNLFNILSAPSVKRAAKKNEAVVEARRIALQMNVLTQVHLTYYSYQDALRQFNRADDIFKVDNRLAEIANSAAKSNTDGSLRQISANVTSILSQVRRYQAMSKVQETAGQVQATLGIEPAVPSLDETSLSSLTSMVSGWLASDFGMNTMPTSAPLLLLNQEK